MGAQVGHLECTEVPSEEAKRDLRTLRSVVWPREVFWLGPPPAQGNPSALTLKPL